MNNLEFRITKLYNDLKSHIKTIRNTKSVHLNNKELIIKINETLRLWFDYKKDYEKLLGKDSCEKYNLLFEKLLRLCNGVNRTRSFITEIEKILKNYKSEIILLYKKTSHIEETKITEFDNFFTLIDNVDDSEYLKEAVSCAKSGFLKASVVLGWCAAIDRIHKIIEKEGFNKFNIVSQQMKLQKIGRYKNFNQEQNVQSISELGEVFDSQLLWIIEGMKLIDINQHVRLRNCFEMRCHASHPGEAPITFYNVMSFFSDIEEIIMKSEKFQL